MKKQEIKKAVAKAKDKFLPKAIQEEAEYKAREEVRRALEPPPLDAARPYEDTPVDPGPAEKPSYQMFSSNDPKLSGY